MTWLGDSSLHLSCSIRVCWQCIVAMQYSLWSSVCVQFCMYMCSQNVTQWCSLRCVCFLHSRRLHVYVQYMCVCACFRSFCAGGSGLCGDVIGAAGWGDMGLEFGRGPDSSSPQNVSDQEVCDCPCLSVCQRVSLCVCMCVWSVAAVTSCMQAVCPTLIVKVVYWSLYRAWKHFINPAGRYQRIVTDQTATRHTASDQRSLSYWALVG